MTNKVHVTLVVDPDFGQRAKAQSKVGPLWVVGSPANKRAIEELWATEVSPYANAPTYFAAVAGRSREEAAHISIGTVHDHHPDWQIFEVVGVGLSGLLLEELRGCAAGSAKETPTGFVFTREDSN